jgi:hypothetical protein
MTILLLQDNNVDMFVVLKNYYRVYISKNQIRKRYYDKKSALKPQVFFSHIMDIHL